MPCAVRRLRRDEDGLRPVCDTLLLDHETRKNPSGRVIGLRGLSVDFSLPRGTILFGDDLLLLDDGGVVEVLARPEPLIEARAVDPTRLARAAWLLGDHHISAELSERKLRVRRSAAVVSLLASLGLKLLEIEAPFEPEGGAYDHHG